MREFKNKNGGEFSQVEKLWGQILSNLFQMT